MWILWLLAPLGLLWGVSAGTPPGGANATTTHNIDSNNDYAHKKDDDVNDGSKKKGGGDKTAKKPRSAPTKEADTRRVSASIWWALTAALAFYLLVLNTLSNLDPANPVNLEVQRRFWFQPLLVVVLLIGRALSGISHICRQTDSMFDLTDLTVGMLIALTQILFNWTDFSDAFVMEDFSRAIINSLPLGAILVAEGDAPFFGTSAVAYALGERLDLLIISSSFLMSPFFQRNYEKSTGMKLPGERYGYGPKPLFNNADLLNTWIHRDKKRVFFIASQFTHPDDQSHAEHFAVRNMGVVNEFIPMSLFEEIGEAAMSEPLANAVKDWDLKKGAMGSYVEELLYALPLELPNSFNGSHNVMPLETNGTAGDEGADLNLTQPAIMYDIHTWESEILRNFKSLMSVNVEQLLAFASHDDVRARDVALPQEVADIVAGNTSVASFLRRSKQQDRQPPPSSILFSTPMRYQMLVVARALLQNNRLVAAKVLLPAPTAPSVDDLLMFRVMQQLMRFHLCSENGHPPLALFDETASIASTVLEAAKTFGVEDTEYFSRRDVLDYMVWLKRRVTRHNPEC
ncbi:membrane-associated protein, putative [Bodo saltans]|uniref:Membrane-associated protein, putative n=1 Tax=Bodo saltans TaxID=75058 RepID=A0A0S4J0Q6_BODSA|nr:membrane-associated protein, putative [Bodo saltans]|eukprot:CUG38866.1 membrane-associated protein, putative [Bodo saltans]